MIEYKRILSDICDRLVSLTKGHFEINENTQLVEQLNLDSLKIMELILDVEDHFDISIPVNILREVKTVKDLVKQIEKLSCGEE